MKEESKGLKHLYRSTLNSISGLKTVFVKERAFRQELLLLFILTPFSFLLADNMIQWIVLIIPFFTLVITELINSSIEATVDRIGEEFHPLSKNAKDMGSAAVFINLVFLGAIWTLFILRYFGVLDFNTVFS